MSKTNNNNVRIIVVDDEEIVLSLVRDALEEEGHQITTASSAHEALQYIESEPVDLIITDIRMPHMDGLEMIRQARVMRPDVVVIFMTGYANLNSARDAISQGAFEYIQKPFELNEIRQAVANAVEKIQRDDTEKSTGKQLDQLSDLNQMLYSAGDIKSLATLSLKFAMMHCNSSCGTVLYWNTNQRNFKLIEITGEETEEKKLPDQPLADCLDNINPDELERPFHVSNIEEHPFYKANPVEQLEQLIMPDFTQHMESAIIVPIKRASTLYGLIMVGLGSDSTAVKDSDLTFLAVTSSQLALSLENLLLLKEAQEAYAQLKELQDETIQLEKMATRGEMSAEIGHELNNFLGVVTGNISMLDFHLRKNQYDHLDRYVHGIIDNVEKIKKFTSNLMDLSPISSQKEIIYFDKLLIEVIDYLKPQKRYHGVSIRVPLIDDAIPFMADATHIQQLLYNLFNNAADAMIDCDTREINVGLYIDKESSTFAVIIRDSGSGVDPELLQKAFKEKFTTKKTGHGFGLLVCKRIIDAHEGKLTIESAPGQGTSIKIDFPLAVVADPVAQTPA